MRRAILLIAVVAVLAAQASTPPRVAIIRATAFAFDDESISIMVQVEPRAENRALIVSAVEDGVAVRSSLEALDGDKARKTRWIEWSRLPAGEFHLVATLWESEPKPVARAWRPITVLSRR